MCPKCGSQHTKKYGHFRNKQRYCCYDCGRQFLTRLRKSRLQKVLWQKYVWKRQTVRQLAKEYRRSEKWIRLQLDKTPINKRFVDPCPIVVVADATFIKRTFGICVLRSSHLKKNLIWKISLTETADIYHELRRNLEKQGFKILAAVIDGKPGVINVFWDMPVQMCHFHQVAIMTRYLTTKPKLTAGKELRQISLTIPKSSENELQHQLNKWHNKWKGFLKEKTFNPETKRWFYTHKRLRSAYRSINKNLPILYTYQKYPHLKIPNTTNSLDGTFAHLKDMLRIHRGLNFNKKLKMIDEILSK